MFSPGVGVKRPPCRAVWGLHASCAPGVVFSPSGLSPLKGAHPRTERSKPPCRRSHWARRTAVSAFATCFTNRQCGVHGTRDEPPVRGSLSKGADPRTGTLKVKSETSRRALRLPVVWVLVPVLRFRSILYGRAGVLRLAPGRWFAVRALCWPVRGCAWGFWLQTCVWATTQEPIFTERYTLGRLLWYLGRHVVGTVFGSGRIPARHIILSLVILCWAAIDYSTPEY